MEPNLRLESTFDAAQMLQRHRRKITATFVVVVALVAGYTLVAKRLYTSEAKLFVRMGRETVGLDPTATNGEVVNIQQSREHEIKSVQELLQSRAVLDEVVATIGAARILEAGEKDGPGLLSRLNPLSVYSPSDNAIFMLRKRLSVSYPEDTSVITLSYDAADPKLADEVLGALIRSAIDAHVRVTRIEGSDKFFLEQAQKLQNEVAELDQQLLKLRNTTGIAQWLQQREIQLQHIATLKSALLDTDTELRSARASLASREAALKSQPEQLVLSQVTGMPNTSAQGMREQLYTLQLREKELASKNQDNMFMVEQIREQIASAEKTLKEEKEPVQITRGLNTSHQELHLAVLTQRAQTSALEAKHKSLDEKLAAAIKDLEFINSTEVQLAAIERQLDLAKSGHKNYSQKYEQARIDRALGSELISNLNVLQAPKSSLIPTSPRIVLHAALAIVAGIFAGLLVALLAEYLDDTVRTPHELQDLDLPLFGTMPVSHNRIISFTTGEKS